jgi:hypothetical protein
MYLTSSAIKFWTEENPDYPVIICGKRHADIYERMFYMREKYIRETLVEGFMTNELQFVDRYDATGIAMDAGQIPFDFQNTLLYSEDVWR